MGDHTVDVFHAEPVDPGLAGNNRQAEAGREIRGDFGRNGNRGRRSDQDEGGGGEGR